MTIQLHTLIIPVREGLSELPNDLVSDEQIYHDLKLAHSYINTIIRDDFNDDGLLQNTILALGTYFTYNNYLTLAERNFGNVPMAAMSQSKILKSIALAFLRQISDLPIDNDLSVDVTKLNGIAGVSVGLVNNIWQ